MKQRRILMACLAVLALGVASGGPALAGGGGHSETARVDFTNDPTGAKPNGYTSRTARQVHFSDSMGADLEVFDFGNQSRGQALAVNGDDASLLIIDLDANADCIRLWFGNDDPGFSNPGDVALLTVYLEGSQVGETGVELNRNDLMDQQISVCGVAFDQATFFYDVTTDGLIEVVDEISIRLA